MCKCNYNNRNHLLSNHDAVVITYVTPSQPRTGSSFFLSDNRCSTNSPTPTPTPTAPLPPALHTPLDVNVKADFDEFRVSLIYLLECKWINFLNTF